MASKAGESNGRRDNAWRVARWAVAATLMLLPAVAMQFTKEVNWTGSDFVFAGVLIGGVGLIYELAVRRTPNLAYRAGVAVALTAAFLLIWINAAVGIIGSEDNPLNLMYGGVLAVGLAGALAARFRPLGMARAFAAAAAAQILVGVIAVTQGHFMLPLDAFFAALWLLAAGLFRKAAQEQQLRP